jgi:hypothetical protein
LFLRDITGTKATTPSKNLLGSSPSEDYLNISETKHDRRTASRPKVFVSARKLQKKVINP